jgi:type IV pilus assembly protein PilE
MFIPPHHAKQFGFTFVELMITVAIIGILVAIAMPGYRQYILRGNRAAAQAEMMDIANREQQFLPSIRRYASKDELVTSGYALPTEVSRNYSYGITLGTGQAPTYTITFTAIGGQTGDGNLTLDSTGTKTPANKW